MDRNRRLMCRIVVLVCTVYALASKPENSTDFKNTTVTEQYSAIRHITKDYTKDDKHTTSAYLRNKQLLEIFTMASITESKVLGPDDDITEKEDYSNASKITQSSQAMVALDVVTDLVIQSSQAMLTTDVVTDRVIQSSQATLATDVVTDRVIQSSQDISATDVLTDRVIQFSQDMSPTDVVTDRVIQSAQDASATDAETDRVFHSSQFLTATDSTNVGQNIAPHMNVQPVTATSDSSNQEIRDNFKPNKPKVVTPVSVLDSNISTTEIFFTSVTSFDFQMSSSRNVPNRRAHNTSFYDACHQYSGCDLVPGPYWYCLCDDMCEEYKDCCRDYAFTKHEANYKYTCVSIDSNANLWGIQTISKCPKNYENTSTVTQCSDGRMTDVGPPVLDVNDKSRVYKNKHCAMCHGVKAIGLGIMFSLKPSNSFPQESEQLNLTNDEFKRYLFRVAAYRFLIPKDANPRYCLANLVRNDNYFCNLYSNPILYKGKYYRNGNCIESPRDILRARCLNTIMESLIDNLARSSDVNPKINKLTILFSFNQNHEIPNEDRCEVWSQHNDKECAHLAKTTNAFIDCSFTMSLPINLTTMETMQSILLSLFVKDLHEIINVGLPKQILVDDDLTLVHVEVGCVVEKRVFSHELTDIKRRIDQQRLDITDKNNNDRWLISNKELKAKTFNTSINKNLRPLRDFLDDRNNYYIQMGMHLPDVTWSGICADVLMIFERYNNGSLHIISLICQSQLSEQRSSHLLAILTLVFCAVSCVSLVVMIAYNRLQHLHREIPFSNLENLGICLIFSHIFLTIGQTAPYINKWVCYAISVISHYLWLTVFSFKSLAVLHIVKTLLQLKNRRFDTKEDKTRKRRKITGIGLILPLLFVVPAIIVDQHGPMYFSPGYINEAICFPIRFPGNFIFFTGPVLAVIIINTACTVQIIIRIHLAKVAASNIRQSSTFSEAKIFMRILCISGCFWITGIIAAYLKSEWLEYVFTVLCGLQGFFVAIANLTTRSTTCFRGKNEHTDET